MAGTAENESPLCIKTQGELSLLISGDIHCGTIPEAISGSISSYHWPKFFDYFNAFCFKQNPDRNLAKQIRAGVKRIHPNSDIFKHFIIPLNEIKQSHLLPFDEVIISDDGVKTGKYSSYRSNHCLSVIKQENCAIHQVVLDKNDESIYHLMDSFVVNKFVALFRAIDANIHWHQPSKSLPAGRGPFRSGFRCVGSQKIIQNFSERSYLASFDDPDKPWEGKWTSWQEIMINDNDLKTEVFEILMKGIVTSKDWVGGNYCKLDIDVDCYEEQRIIFGELFLKIFEKNTQQNKIRAFWCQHSAFDFFHENLLLRDKILCCVDDEKLVAVWSMFHRWYG